MAISVWDFTKLVTWSVEQGVLFWSAFECAGFAPSRAKRHQVTGKVKEEIEPEFSSAFLVGSSIQRGAELAQSVQGSFETEAVELGVELRHRLGHEAADQIVGDQVGQQFLFRHGWGLTAQLFHAHHGFEVSQAQFQAPAAGIKGDQLLRRIEFGVQERGHQGDAAVAMSSDARVKANDSHGELARQGSPAFLV